MQNKRKWLFWGCIAVLIIAVAFLVVWYVLNKERSDIYKQMQIRNEEMSKELATKSEISDEKEPVVIPIDFKSIQKENKDIYAWIRIPDTEVDYPILQSDEDDEYYLEHTVEGKKGLPGSIYTEALNSKDFQDRNTVIYGHNMKNGSMFGNLKLYMDSEYMKEHSTMIIYTPEHIYTYKIFAAITYDNRHILYNFDFSSDEGLEEFLDETLSVRNMQSYVDEEVEVKRSDKIVTLSTCTANEEQRFLVEAVLIDEQ